MIVGLPEIEVTPLQYLMRGGKQRLLGSVAPAGATAWLMDMSTLR